MMELLSFGTEYLGCPVICTLIPVMRKFKFSDVKVLT